MYKENKVQTCTQRNLALSYKAEFNYLICKNMKLNLKKITILREASQIQNDKHIFLSYGQSFYHTYIFFHIFMVDCGLFVKRK